MLEQRQAREQAESLFRLLPEKHRPLFRLIYADGLKPAEVAERLGIKVGTVYARERRGLKTIRRAMRADPQIARRIDG